MKILHVASFNGNIGDMANHSGFYKSFRMHVCKSSNFSPCEIRNFYQHRKEREFDFSFAELANSYDLLVFGGGVYLEPIWNYSTTGTTLNISDDVLEAIKVPILLNVMGGISKAKGSVPTSIERLGKFLSKITTSPKCLVALRNDGSYAVAKDLYGPATLAEILQAPDNGYFLPAPRRRSHSVLAKDRQNIAIQVAGDNTELKFTGSNGLLDVQGFIREFADLCVRLLTHGAKLHLVFVPHIFKDLEIIYAILRAMPDRLSREMTSVAPLLNGTVTDSMAIYDLYRQCALTIGMRHHAHIPAVGMGIPTIGIVSYLSNGMEFIEEGLEHLCINVNKAGFSERIFDIAADMLKEPAKYRELNAEAKQKLTVAHVEYMKKIKLWLENLNAL